MRPFASGAVLDNNTGEDSLYPPSVLLAARNPRGRTVYLSQLSRWKTRERDTRTVHPWDRIPRFEKPQLFADGSLSGDIVLPAFIFFFLALSRVRSIVCVCILARLLFTIFLVFAGEFFSIGMFFALFWGWNAEMEF